MAEKKFKEGVTVQELENIGKKYKFQIVFLVYFILASIFSFVFFGASWCIYLAALGGILGVWLPRQIEKFGQVTMRFVFKQEKITQIILAVVGVIVSIFLPPIIYIFLGLMGGTEIHKLAAKASGGTMPSGGGEPHEM